MPRSLSRHLNLFWDVSGGGWPCNGCEERDICVLIFAVRKKICDMSRHIVRMSLP